MGSMIYVQIHLHALVEWIHSSMMSCTYDVISYVYDGFNVLQEHIIIFIKTKYCYYSMFNESCYRNDILPTFTNDLYDCDSFVGSRYVVTNVIKKALHYLLLLVEFVIQFC